MARSRYKFAEDNQPHFLTCTVVGWFPLFKDEFLRQILIDSLTHLQKEKRLTIYAYVIMPDHVHLIASSNNLSKEIGDFKSFTARAIIDLLTKRQSKDILAQLRHYKLRHKKKSTYQVWQEGSHPQVIQGQKMMRQKIDYIHYNPVEAGYVDDPLDWKYSSARNYEGLAGVLEVNTNWY